MFRCHVLGPTDLFLGGTINETILTWVTRLGNNTYAARGCMDNLWSYMLGNITSVGTERSCFYIDGSLYGAYGMVKICVCNQDNCNIQRPSLQRDAIGNGAETFHHRYLSTIFAMLIIGLTVRYGSSHIII